MTARNRRPEAACAASQQLRAPTETTEEPQIKQSKWGQVELSKPTSDGVDFFHMDALSSVVAMKVNCDLQLTLMGSSLYRLLGARVGGAYATAGSRHIYRDFVQASAQVTVAPDSVEVRFGKRARNPYLLDAGFAETDVPVPWWKWAKAQARFSLRQAGVVLGAKPNVGVLASSSATLREKLSESAVSRVRARWVRRRPVVAVRHTSSVGRCHEPPFGRRHSGPNWSRELARLSAFWTQAISITTSSATPPRIV